MIPIYCSNKLSKLGEFSLFTPHEEIIEKSIGGWNAQLFILNRKKYIMFVNNKTFYSVIVSCFLKKNLKQLETLFLKRYIEQLIFDKVIAPVDGLLVQLTHLPLVFTKTNNDRKTIGTMNDFILNFKFTYDLLEEEENGVKELNHNINTSPIKTRNISSKKYTTPIADMKVILEMDNSMQ